MEEKIIQKNDVFCYACVTPRFSLDCAYNCWNIANLVESKASIPLAKKESGKAGHKKGASDGGDDNADVIQALEALGYKKSEVLQRMEKAQFQEGMSLEQKVQEALKATIK